MTTASRPRDHHPGERRPPVVMRTERRIVRRGRAARRARASARREHRQPGTKYGFRPPRGQRRAKRPRPRYGSVERILRLPAPVRPALVSAEDRDGILAVRIPLADPVATRTGVVAVRWRS